MHIPFPSANQWMYLRVNREMHMDLRWLPDPCSLCSNPEVGLSYLTVLSVICMMHPLVHQLMTLTELDVVQVNPDDLCHFHSVTVLTYGVDEYRLPYEYVHPQ